MTTNPSHDAAAELEHVQITSSEDVRSYVAGICFKTGPPMYVGSELEWLVISPDAPHVPVPPTRIRAALDPIEPLPGGSRVSFEPGGQLELSSPPASGSTACWKATRADVDHLQRLLAAADLDLVWSGIDPYRPATRQVANSRYDTMQVYFDACPAVSGTSTARIAPDLPDQAGRLMMCSTASVQINLDAGADATDIARRWRLLHAVGPPLVAAFANSPVYDRRTTGWKSTRQAAWLGLDPCRTRQPQGEDPLVAWADYALDARVMACRRDPTWIADPGMTFRQWIDGAGHLGRPTYADLDYHLTTLFPPVRPRGWLEVRYVDAQPAAYWPVPLAVVAALVDADADRVLATTEPVREMWWEAARYGLEDRELAAAASACFELALATMSRDGADDDLRRLVESYADRYVLRRRCPADDQEE
ncbi:MAG TPA: ergothioneine biosynthesis glutamate--cysteine ligase EgtA [Actinopolymorphaceae bacterium]|jgi:glutamate--cysteine ligase